MVTIPISKDLLPLIFIKASKQSKEISDVVDDLLRNQLVKEGTTIVYKCSNCDTVIKDIVDHNKGNCSQCESLVLVYSNQ